MNEWHVLSWIFAILAAFFAIKYVLIDTQEKLDDDD